MTYRADMSNGEQSMPVPERRARAIVWMFEHNAPSSVEALKEFAPKTYAAMLAELREFERVTASQG